MATWQYSEILWFPTLTDFKASNVRAPVLFTRDLNDITAGFCLDETDNETGVEDVDWIVNASGVHYRRKDVSIPTP